MRDPQLKRHVFYFHGFDRRSPRFFNLWQKKEARTYRTRHGGNLRIGDLEGNSWEISSDFIQTRFHFMDWTDIIKARFDQPFWTSAGSMFSLFPIAVRQGLFGKVRRADWAIGFLMIWAFLPAFFVIVSLASALFFGVAPAILIFISGLALSWALYRFDSSFGVFYALHIAWIARRIALRDHALLESRIDAFTEALAGADADEIILVGHSIGSALAVRLLECAPDHAKLLTVGQSIPLVSFQAEAEWLREALELCNAKSWIDVSAGRDVLGFSAFDPSLGGAECVSAHLGRSFDLETLNALKWRGFDMHFQYFIAPEYIGAAWDWFGILSKRIPLEERFEAEVRLSGKGERRGRI